MNHGSSTVMASTSSMAATFLAMESSEALFLLRGILDVGSSQMKEISSFTVQCEDKKPTTSIVSLPSSCSKKRRKSLSECSTSPAACSQCSTAYIYSLYFSLTRRGHPSLHILWLLKALSREKRMEWRLWLPCIAMIVVQIGYAGMNVISKLAMNSGMNPIVMVTYRQLFATLVLLPFAYFCEIRKTKPRITRHILLMNFISSWLGATLNQWFYFVGLKHTTPTLACGLNNALPAITFLMAWIFRLETLGKNRKAGAAKLLGTVICIGGAMLMSFYKGKLINFGKSSIHWGYIQNMKAQGNEGNTVFGAMLVLASCVAWAGWFILQAKMNNTFLGPYTSTTLMSAMATIECGIIGAFSEQHISEWSLGFNIRLVAALYSGAVGSALAFCLMSWCIEKKGPLYVSIFMPLLLVIMAVVGWTLLDEKIHMGTAVGAGLIVLGLYTFIWGTNRAKNQRNSVEENMSSERMEHQVRDDLESNNVEVMHLEMMKHEKRDDPESKDVAEERHDPKLPVLIQRKKYWDYLCIFEGIKLMR